MGITRVTLSLPRELLEEVERRFAKDDESRSALIRRLMESALKEAEEEEAVRRYVEGYQQDPQTEEEFGWQDALVPESLSQLPWK